MTRTPAQAIAQRFGPADVLDAMRTILSQRSLIRGSEFRSDYHCAEGLLRIAARRFAQRR